jgi:hypothetical protein
VEKFKPCPYCGVLFSGKYGPEKRQQHRVKKEIPFVFTHNGQNMQGCTRDVSEHGFCLKVFGSPSLPVGETIDFNVDDINLRAQVIWVSDNSHSTHSLTGIRIVDGAVTVP